MNDAIEVETRKEPPDIRWQQPSGKPKWLWNARISLGIILAAAWFPFWEYVWTGGVSVMADTPIFPIGEAFVFVIIVVLALSVLVNTTVGILWTVLGPIGLRGRNLLWLAAYLALYVTLLVVIPDPVGVPFELCFFVLGGVIVAVHKLKKVENSQFAQLRDFVCKGFRFCVWLYVATVILTAFVGKGAGDGPMFERGRVFLGHAPLYCSLVILIGWVFVRLRGLGITKPSRRLACTATLVLLGATLLLAGDLAMLKAYFWGDYGKLIAAADPRGKDSAAMKLVKMDARAFYIDKEPVSFGEFIAFLNANPQWQPDGKMGREFIVSHRGKDAYSVYLRGIEKLFEYLPIDLMGVHPSHLGEPVIHVNTDVATAYAEWVGKRLPTREELKAAGVDVEEDINNYIDAAARAELEADGIDVDELDFIGTHPIPWGLLTSDRPAKTSDERFKFRCVRDVMPGRESADIATEAGAGADSGRE